MRKIPRPTEVDHLGGHRAAPAGPERGGHLARDVREHSALAWVDAA